MGLMDIMLLFSRYNYYDFSRQIETERRLERAECLIMNFPFDETIITQAERVVTIIEETTNFSILTLTTASGRFNCLLHNDIWFYVGNQGTCTQS